MGYMWEWCVLIGRNELVRTLADSGGGSVDMGTVTNLLPEPPPTLLPVDEAAQALAQAEEGQLAAVVAEHPASSLVWATLAEATFDAEADISQHVAAYAYARVGYHRGLDALRRNGWKGHGPVPWSHEPNRGFLRALAILAQAASAIGEADEAARCAQFLRDCDPAAADELH